LIENKVSEAKAAEIAKELTVNFNRKGNMGQALNALYLFYNASVQGSVRVIQAMVKSKQVRRLVYGTIGFAAALDMLNRMLSGDDDDGENRYDKIPPWVKERNLVVVLGDNGYVKIPLPWGYNVFHVMGQAIGEVLTKENNDHLESALRIVGAAADAFNPVGGTNSILQFMSPTISDPLVQWAENKDWSGRKIRPGNNPFAEKPQSQLYWNSVRKPSKWITEKLNALTGGDEVRPGTIDISPEAIDLVVDTFTGGAGKFVSDIVSTPLKAAKGEDIESYEIPLLRRVYGQTGRTATMSEFYDNLEDVGIAKRQLQYHRGKPEKQAEIRTAYPGQIRMVPSYNITKKRLKRLNDRLKKFKDDPSKKAEADRIRDKINDLMVDFNKKYYQRVNKE